MTIHETIQQCIQLIDATTGIFPGTDGWEAIINQLNDRNISDADIIAALKIALKDDWHRPRILDKGLRHIANNYYTLVSPSKQKSSGRSGDIGLSANEYKRGYHLRWDVENHKMMDQYKRNTGEYPPLAIIQKFVDLYMQNNIAIADDVILCPVCIEEIKRAQTRGESPFLSLPKEFRRDLE